ncbi:MAG TPA: hypothetical protein VMW16_13975 [Sedimentisphaerales bacterium]|nr:hypothetical protein [Sedimentisphaerales bacterium]
MKITKRTVASLERVYSISAAPGLKAKGWPAFLGGSEGDGPLLYFEPPQYEPIEIANEPGGFISLWAFERETGKYVVAATDFKPGFKAENCRIIVYPLDERVRGEAFEVGRLPYTHRVAVLAVGGRQCFLGSTLCSAKAFKYDWTQPGGVHLAVIPDKIENKWEFRQIVTGLNKNHGMDYGQLDKADRGGFLLSAMEGLFFMRIPDSPEDRWGVETIAEGEHSDAFAYDWDAAGYPQIFAISPFHGNTVTIYRREQSRWSGTVIADDISMGHVLWAGELLGRPGLLVGGRDGRKELRLYRKSGPQGKDFSYELIDEGIGPTQIAVAALGKDATGLIVAAHAVNEVRTYTLTE